MMKGHIASPRERHRRIINPIRTTASVDVARPRVHPPAMGTKQIVQDLLQKLPEDVSLHDIAQEIEFVAGVRQGLGEIERGERIPIGEIERELPSWVSR